MSRSGPSLEAVVEPGSMPPGAGLVPPPRPKVFITAPLAADTSVLRELLESRGMTPFEIAETQTRSETILDTIGDSLDQADLVIAVLGGEQPNDSVLFELGYAAALKKRILVLIPADAPAPVYTFPYLRAQADNKEAISFGLDHILAMPQVRHAPPQSRVHQTRPIGDQADSLLQQIHSDSGLLDEQTLNKVVLDLMKACGIVSISRESTRGPFDGGGDLAIWSNDFEPWVGNPIVIELKRDLRSRDELQRAAEQLSQYLDASHAGCGLLIYATSSLDLDEVRLEPRLFAVTIAQLIEALRTSSLGDLLKRMKYQRRSERA